jgi:hypothetical protein
VHQKYAVPELVDVGDPYAAGSGPLVLALRLFGASKTAAELPGEGGLR